MNRLSEKDMRLLKENGLVGEADMEYMMGQTIVVENVRYGEKRIIEAPHLLLECKKQILRV